VEEVVAVGKQAVRQEAGCPGRFDHLFIGGQWVVPATGKRYPPAE
jgi:hypothetical protein